MSGVELRGVTVRLGGRVVIDALDLQVAPGETMAVVGASGAGKTTLLRTVAGLVRPTAGTVSRPRGVAGYVFQEPRLLPWRSALDNVTFVLGRRPTPAERDRARSLLHQLDLDDAEDLPPKALSGGMRQRVSIARALFADPDTVLVDEPFGALDAGMRARLTDDLTRMLGSRPRCVLWVTHSLAEAAAVGDRILFLASRPSRWHLVRPGSDHRERRDPERADLEAHLTALLHQGRLP